MVQLKTLLVDCKAPL